MESLSKQVLEANENHKNALDQYTNKLQAELNNVDNLIVAVEDLSANCLQEDHGDKWCLHADGAFKPTSIIDSNEILNEKSPFFHEAIRRERYVKSLVPSPFSASEKRYLEKAIVKENKRLAAIRAQQSGQNVFEAVALDNEFFLQNIEGIDWNSVARDVSASNSPLGSRSAQDCRVRWLGAQSPKINSGSWSEEEEKSLLDLVESKRQSGHLDWEEIAKHLGTNRTALDCIKRFRASARTTFRWTSPLDSKLVEAVKQHGSSNWVLVASSVSPEVSANQCQIRFERSLNPEIKRGKFSTEEDELLMKAIELHGSDWVKVAQVVPGRTNAQCRGRYKLQLTGGIVKAPWDPEDDNRLRAAVSKHGHKWDKVREEMGASRHQTQYATRYKVITRRDAQDKPDQDVIGRASPASQSYETNDKQVVSTSRWRSVKRTKIVDLADAPDSVPAEIPKIRRGRKRKVADSNPEANVEVRRDNSCTPAPNKKPRPTPRRTGAIVQPDTTISEDITSAGNPLDCDSGPATAENMQISGNNPPLINAVTQASNEDPLGEFSDLTDLDDTPPPSKHTKAKGIKSFANRTAKRDRRITQTTAPQSSSPHTMTTRLSTRSMTKASSGTGSSACGS